MIQGLKAICHRLKVCKLSADNNSASKKTLTVFLALLTMAIAAIAAWFIFNITQINFGWIVIGASIALVALKGIMEWVRQRATSYDEFIGNASRPSQRFSAERGVLWLSNLSLFTISCVVGFLLGVTSAAFLYVTLIAAAWGIGQILSSAAFRAWLHSKQPPIQPMLIAENLNATSSAASEALPPAQQPPEVRSADGIGMTPSGSLADDSSLAFNRGEEKTREDNSSPVPATLSNSAGPLASGLLKSTSALASSSAAVTIGASRDLATEYYDLQKTADHKIVQGAEFCMRSYFITAAFFGIFGGQKLFANLIFNTVWNYVDSVGSIPGIAINAKNNKDNADSWEKNLLRFEKLAATLLFLSNTATVVAEYTDTFGSGKAAVSTLANYGFALSMTASMMRAMKDTYTAWDELSPRYLLEDRLKKYAQISTQINILDEENPQYSQLKQQAEQLLNEAKAIARVKRHEIVEEGGSVYDIFVGLVDGLRGEELKSSLNELATPEEELFVKTLLENNHEKFIAALANFLGYLAAAICFWFVALAPLNLTLESFGGGSQIFLVSGGAIKLLQVLIGFAVAEIDKSKLKDADKIADILLNDLSLKIKVAELPSLDEVVLQAFFTANKISEPKEQTSYRIAYYLRKQVLQGQDTGQQLLESIYDNHKKADIFKVALDEFVLLMHNNPSKKEGHEVLYALASQDAALKKVALRGDMELRQKTVAAILTSGLFKHLAGPVTTPTLSTDLSIDSKNAGADPAH